VLDDKLSQHFRDFQERNFSSFSALHFKRKNRRLGHQVFLLGYGLRFPVFISGFALRLTDMVFWSSTFYTRFENSLRSLGYGLHASTPIWYSLYAPFDKVFASPRSFWSFSWAFWISSSLLHARYTLDFSAGPSLLARSFCLRSVRYGRHVSHSIDTVVFTAPHSFGHVL
jgi:hypothetical protein